MAIVQLDTETTTPDITSTITVLTHTPSTTLHTQCQGFLSLSGLDGTGGTFEFTISIGGVSLQPTPQEVVFAATATAALKTDPFPVPANTAVLLRIKSPNAGDSAGVTCVARLFDVGTSALETGVLSGVASNLMLDRLYTRLFHEVNVTDADGTAAIRNAADDGNIATGSITDDDTTTSQAAWTWA